MQTVKLSDLKLAAVVRHVKPTSGRVKHATHITVVVRGGGSDITVAEATVGGKYSQDDALAEFRRNPGRFKRLDGFEVADRIGLLRAA